MLLTEGVRAPEPTSVNDVIHSLTKWFTKNNRITVGLILKSLDRGGFGELRDREFNMAFERMGVVLSATDNKFLKSVLDHRTTGFLKYGPLVRQLQGIPTKDFLFSGLEKLAELVRQKDLLREDFTYMVDSRTRGVLQYSEYKTAMQNLRSADFSIFDEELDKIFLIESHEPAIKATSSIKVEELVDSVYYATKAVMIHMMQRGLRNSRRFLIDILAARDTNQDGYLEY